MQLRQLAQQLKASPPSPDRDELLVRTRLRIVEIETRDEFGPPSPHPALAEDLTSTGPGLSPG
jgi:hypothetical protein